MQYDCPDHKFPRTIVGSLPSLAPNESHRQGMRKTGPKKKYRLILQEEVTFKEKWALGVKPGQLKWMAAGTTLIIVGVTYFLVALTPFRQWAVPGYTSEETRRMQAEAWRVTDSLSRELDIQSRYLSNLVTILEGKQPETLPTDSAASSKNAPLPGVQEQTPSLDHLRDEIAQEDAFTIGGSRSLEDAGLWMSPVDGTVSDAWNPAIGHWGIDLVAPENSPVQAVGRGSVIFAGFTAGGGHTVMVQHPEDRVSVYMHNSRLITQTGAQVQPGDVIAIIGNSGDHSTGPHLHFEWWEAGTPIDPALRINLRN